MVNLPFSPGRILGCYQFMVRGIHVIVFSLQTVEHLQGLDKFQYCFIEGSQNLKLAIREITNNHPKLQYVHSSSIYTLPVCSLGGWDPSAEAI